jgi:hypothetical protein
VLHVAGLIAIAQLDREPLGFPLLDGDLKFRILLHGFPRRLTAWPGLTPFP